MDIGVLRDFVIVIGGFLFLVVVILAGLLGFLIYRDVKSLISSVKNTIQTAKQLGSNAGQMAESFKTIINIFKEKKTEAECKPSGSKSA